MSERIPQSVAKLVVFRAFLASDGKTPATGKTIAITISKNGGAFGNPNAGATNATEISSGFYKFTLDTTDNGTKGPVAWRGAEATINDAGDVYTVVNATNADFTALPAAAADSGGGLPISDAGGLDLDAKLANTDQVTVARMGALTDWIDGGRLDLLLDAIKAKTDNLPSDPADASDILAVLATIQAFVDTEVAAILADTTQIKADLPQRITKNVALAKFPFIMLDSADHVTPKTGLTITATRSLDGAAFGACANAAVEIANGWYYIDLANTDLNGNTVALRLTAAGADTRNITLVTQPT